MYNNYICFFVGVMFGGLIYSLFGSTGTILTFMVAIMLLYIFDIFRKLFEEREKEEKVLKGGKKKKHGKNNRRKN